ncbi:NAD-dependent epimerase/dehydratase family protein [Conexibacter sp. SYSU D00693]|uniref:NAD-dependent epimerase/dehydratase family protein n=1 Tax=Conexibacter sp. SYSU D00693 TaxID=2812560 RepID=UPI00196A59B5|nr:NAD-dependent epimerase/dehydratase family protein [Conexibacter sp. SYSU D00693]
MRVAVTGATGNHGTALLRALAVDDGVEAIVGIARRVPDGPPPPKVTWHAADVSRDELTPAFHDCDAVVHLAWLIQPGRDEPTMRATNVEGSRRVFEAALAAGVRHVVYASSVGTYAPGPKDRRVDESHPHTGIPSSIYSRHKAAVEALLDELEPRNPDTRFVRIRPGLVFQRDAATQVRRLFAGPFLPNALVRPGLLPVLPLPDGLVVQCVHSDDVALAYRSALHRPGARGAFNIAAEPALPPGVLARALGTRHVSAPAGVVRALASLTFKARLQPTEPGWFDMGMQVPVMDTSRAGRELGWEPRVSADEALRELVEGMRQGAGHDTPPLDPRTSGPARVREVLTGVGRTSR